MMRYSIVLSVRNPRIDGPWIWIFRFGHKIHHWGILCPMPKGLRKVRISFREDQLSHFAGILLIQGFCQKLGFRRLLHWIPNVAFFQLLLLGFDLVHYFKRLCLPRSYYTKTLKTIRMELLVLPGRFIKAQKRYHLRLSRQYHLEQVFRNALSRVEKLRELPVE